MLENKTSDKSPIPKVDQPRIPFLQIDSFDGTSFIARGAQCCLDHGSCAHPDHLLQLVVFGLKKEHDFKQSILKVEFKDSHRKLSQSNNQSPGLANSRREEPGPPLVCLPQPCCPGKQCLLPRLAVLVAQAQAEPTGSEINTSSNSHPPTQQTRGVALRYYFLTSLLISTVLPAPAVDPMPTSFALACSTSATLFFIFSASFCFLKSTHGSQITSGLTPQVQPSPHVQSGHMHFGLGHFFDVVFFVEEDGSLMIISLKIDLSGG